jgi:hypothetical protein
LAMQGGAAWSPTLCRVSLGGRRAAPWARVALRVRVVLRSRCSTWQVHAVG